MQPVDLLDNELKLSLLLERYRPTTTTEMAKALNEALDNITLKLIKTEESSQKQRLRALIKEITNELQKAYTIMPDLLQEDIKSAAEVAYTSGIKALETHGASAVAFAALPKRAMAAILDMDEILKFGDKGYTIASFVDEQTEYNIKIFRRIIIAGLGEGASPGTISKRLRVVNKRDTANDIDAITRTVIAEARSRASEVAFEQADDVVIGWESIGVLDKHTTPLCATLDGRKWLKSKGWTIEKLKAKNYWYPRHFRCRTVVIGITALSAQLDKDRTRASNMDDPGQISAKTDFQEAFDRQSKAFQKDYLGPARYKLYKEGRMEIKDFVDIKTGREYTIAEIKERMSA
jgi:hypothetical protein